MLEATHRLGGANYVLWGGREGYETLLNTDLAARGGAVRAVPDPGRGAQAQDRLQGHAPHRAQAAGAHQAPVRLRRGDGRRLPGPPRPDRRVPREHRGQPRHPGRPQLPARGGHGHRARASSAASTSTAATTRTAGTPTSSPTRSTRCRWRCTRSSARAASRPAASTSTPSSAARAWTGHDLFHAHIGGMDTLARALLVAADMVERGTLDGPREERYAGWDGELGAVDPERTSARSMTSLRRVEDDGEIDPKPRVRTAGAAREPGQPANLGRRPRGTRCPRRPG